MRIIVPQSAVDAGAIKIWLRTIPVASYWLKAFRVTESGELIEEVSEAYIYGRGEGSNADEACMLQLPLYHNGQCVVVAGEPLELCVADIDNPQHIEPVSLDIKDIN